MTIASTDNWLQVAAAAQATLSPEIVEALARARADEHPDSHLISILHLVQGRFGFLSADRLDAVAQLLGMPTAAVTGVATFYHFFRLLPLGKYRISVCLGTACYVKGASEIADRLRQELGVDFGETSGDGLFTLEGARCLGTCGLAPVVMVGDEVHAKMTPDQIPAMLESYRRKP
ncbi:MAG: NADH-quinone oxidoreductase subunit NuoE [Planctomycetota bacterium]|nr:NADH-quinone oxidoreductase subunit NuoE [Planctomycetota bacterium]